MSKPPEVKDLEIQIYLIEMDFFGNSNFDVWQFWRPLTKNLIQYLIWKISLVVLIYIHAKCVVAIWQPPHSFKDYQFYVIGRQKVDLFCSLQYLFSSFPSCCKPTKVIQTLLLHELCLIPCFYLRDNWILLALYSFWIRFHKSFMWPE